MPEQQMLSTIDERIVTESHPIFQWKHPLVTARCAACREVLAYANDEARAVKLAQGLTSVRPCCEAWK